MRFSLIMLSAAFLLMAKISADEAPATGAIRGVVLADDGKPLAGATVFGQPEHEFLHERRAIADSAGTFELPAIPGGSVWLNAFKETDWYPYSIFSFYLNGPGTPLKVAVEAGKTVANVVLRLGPKAGALNIDVVDQNSALLSHGVSLVFTRDDVPGYYGQGAQASTRHLLVPAVPFHLRVEAAGYQPWSSGLLKVESQKTLDLLVRMKPVTPARPE